eukprot:c19073_g1_i2 orf=556-1041(+)
MTVPGKAVSKKRGKEEKPPLYKKSCQDKRSSNQCSIKVPASGGSLCVLVHVKGPELFQISEVHPQHCRNRKTCPSPRLHASLLPSPPSSLQLLLRLWAWLGFARLSGWGKEEHTPLLNKISKKQPILALSSTKVEYKTFLHVSHVTLDEGALTRHGSNPIE